MTGLDTQPPYALPPAPRCAEFGAHDEAFAQQYYHGGHVFAADDGTAAWFAPGHYKISDVLRHPLTRGKAGVVNPTCSK